MSCEHDWAERGSGPGFRWLECFLCGLMTDWLPAGEPDEDDYGPGLDGIDTAHLVGAAILGAGIALAGIAAFIHHAFITPSRQPRRTR